MFVYSDAQYRYFAAVYGDDDVIKSESFFLRAKRDTYKLLVIIKAESSLTINIKN